MQWHPILADLLRALVQDYYEVRTDVPVGDLPRKADGRETTTDGSRRRRQARPQANEHHARTLRAERERHPYDRKSIIEAVVDLEGVAERDRREKKAGGTHNGVSESGQARSAPGIAHHLITVLASPVAMRYKLPS